jgi:exopolyphosphatase/pppGpp-phosphohydrolase
MLHINVSATSDKTMMKPMKKNLLTLIALASYTLLSVAASKGECIKQRAIFELGSGVTTVALAKVNTCTRSVLEIQKETKKKISYQDALNTNKDGEILSDTIIQEGIEKIQEAKKELGIDCDKIACRGVATAAIRSSKNAMKVVNAIYDKTKVKISVITQLEEGLVGYHSAMIKSKISKQDQETTMVLDIGGGSYQVIYPDHHVYGGMIGGSIFKAMVIELIKGYDLKYIDTPNPMSKKDISKAKLLSKKSIGEPIAGVEDIKRLLKNPKVKVYGIGSFLKAIAQFSNKGGEKTGELEISLRSLTDLIDSSALKNDEDIKRAYKTPYFKEMLTNLILVHGIMTALKIDNLQILDTTNALGALVMPQYWN